jgi:hypothetical protein
MNAPAAERAAELVTFAGELLARGAVRDAIDVLSSANRDRRDPALEQALVHARHVGCALLLPPAMDGPTPAIAAKPSDGALYEVGSESLTAAHVREGLSRSGCVLVRGLLTADRVERLVSGIDAVYAAYDAAAQGERIERDWYDPFPMPDVITPDGAGASVAVAPGSPPAQSIPVKAHRRFTRGGSGIWTVDSPRMLFEVFELVEDTGVGAVITEVLGERPLLSANKCVLRRVPPVDMPGGWHQDGAFLGNDISALNLWIALTTCGRDAPGLDLVPKRFDGIVTPGGNDAFFDWSLSDEDVRAASAGAGIVRPDFEAGDALLFDHRLIHRTAASPAMIGPRHAIEAWFYGPSAFPASQLPLVY